MIFASGIAIAPTPANEAEPALAWRATTVATGKGVRGPWQQNDSRYDYVDDATVALDTSGAAAVAWVDQRASDVFFQVVDREGKRRFGQPVNVSRTPRVFSWLPRIVLSPQHPRDVYVVWQEIVFSGGSHGGDIFFARSRDGGASFEKPLNLSNSMGGDGKGRITRDIWHNGSLDLALAGDGALHAAWTEYDGALWFTTSRDRGESFAKPIQVVALAPARPARAPAIAAGRDATLYLAWTVGEDPHADIRIARSANGGRTFDEPTLVARTSGYSDAPAIAVGGGGIVHLVHAESAGGPFDRYHIRYTRSRDGARTFEAPRTISRDALGRASAAFPVLALDANDHVVAMWERYPDHRERPRGLVLAVSRDAGQTFSAPAYVAGSADAPGGVNGSLQGLLTRKLAVSRTGGIAVVNSSFKEGAGSRAWLMRAELPRSRRGNAQPGR